MASQKKAGGTLVSSYRDRIGEPSTVDEARGYWIFAVGALLGAIGVLMFLVSNPAGSIREVAVVLAAAGLALVFAGPTIRLPLQQTATRVVYVGLFVATVAIVWFVLAFPGQWSPETGRPAIMGLYGIGLLMIAVAGVFVPNITGRGRDEEEESAFKSEIDTLREDLADSEANEAELAEVVEELRRAVATAEDDEANLAHQVAQLREDLADAEADEADLARRVEQLQEDLADAEADEGADAADVGALRTSQSRFELYEDRGEEWRWRLRHRNGNIIATSGQGYTQLHNAKNGMQAVRRDALGAPVHLFEDEEALPAEDEEFEPIEERESDATFELEEDDNGKWRWQLRHENSNIIANGSRGYASKGGARTSIDRIREYVGPAEYLERDPTAIEVYEDEGGEWRWRLVHANGNVLAGSGEGYANRGGARRAIDRLREEIDDMEIEVYEDEAGGFRWRLAGGDTLIKADSGSYESRSGAEDAVERVREFMPEADLIDIGQATFELFEDEAGEFRWRLRHRNGNILARSGRGYADRSGVKQGIETVKQNAPNAGIET